MVCQVLQWSLSSHNSLNKETKHREHSQPPILDLLHLKLSKCLWVISKAQWVKASTQVKWVSQLTERPTSNTLTLNSTHQDNLCGPDGQMLCAWIMLGLPKQSSPPSLKIWADTIAGQELREDTPKSSEHGPSTVDDFKLTYGSWQRFLGQQKAQQCPNHSHQGIFQ